MSLTQIFWEIDNRGNQSVLVDHLWFRLRVKIFYFLPKTLMMVLALLPMPSSVCRTKGILTSVVRLKHYLACYFLGRQNPVLACPFNLSLLAPVVAAASFLDFVQEPSHFLVLNVFFFKTFYLNG